MSTEKYKGMVLEIHRLQSFGVSCLNRDDFGTPKTCIVGGTVRSRISSQCLKRAVRMKMHENGVETAVRTRRLAELVEAAYRKLKYGGRFAFVHRADRTAELLFALKSRGLEPKRVQYVSGREGDSPYLVMIEAVKGGKEGTAVLPLLVNAEERMERTFRQGEIVQHFKRELIEGEKGMKYLYEIVGVAHHSETGEPLMVYRALYGERGMCVRPLSMFLSEVDREKYPQVRQKYRFEAVKEE